VLPALSHLELLSHGPGDEVTLWQLTTGQTAVGQLGVDGSLKGNLSNSKWQSIQ
jgi:hypothetical protein